MPTIAVSGSRELLTLHDQQVIRAELVTHIGVIIHVGDCPTGVDAFMRDVWHKNIRKDFKADWNFGKRGGPERNGRMLIGVSVLLAFPGPKSQRNAGRHQTGDRERNRDSRFSDRRPR